MHRSNEEAYANPESRNKTDVASGDCTGATARPEDKDFTLHRASHNKGIHV